MYVACIYTAVVPDKNIYIYTLFGGSVGTLHTRQCEGLSLFRQVHAT